MSDSNYGAIEYTMEYWMPDDYGVKRVVMTRNRLPQNIRAVRRRGGAVILVQSSYLPYGGERKVVDLTDDYKNMCGYRPIQSATIISGCILDNNHNGRHKDFAGFKFVNRVCE